MLILGLSGCASVSVPQASPSIEITEAAELDALASFKTIAANSCDAAMSQGVVETRDDSGLLVMIPKDQAYEGFSAVYKDLNSGQLDLIYEADSFYACSDALMWAMAEESGESQIDGMNVGYESGQYVVQESFGDSTFTYHYDINGGLISGGTMTSTTDDVSVQFTLVYGDVGAENFALIKQAVDELSSAE